MTPVHPETYTSENDEYLVPDKIALVSKTDLHGTITEVNDAFELASGFSREELIGQPHNIVRHPDVPKNVFKDMWRTLQMGATWSQIVKNRRKDGGYYWVKANVSPIYENNQHIGYLSFRTHVSEPEKTATAEAYRQIKAGKSRIQYGKVYQGINWPQLNWIAQLAPQWQLTLLMTVFAVIPFIGLTQSLLPASVVAATSALMLIPVFLYGLRLSRFQQSIQTALQKVSANEPINMSCHRPKHFVGQLINPVISAAISIRYAIEDNQAKVDEATKLQTAINQISSNLMITDANLNIVYMNDEMQRFMQTEEAKLKEYLPQFDASSLIGQNIDIFHHNAQHQRQLLNELTEPYVANIQIGDTHLEVNTIPIFNRAGSRTATLAEWRDKTQEIQLINQVQKTVDAAKNGLLDQRIDLSRVSGLARELSAAINEMMETIEHPISQAVDLGVALSEGNLTQHMQGEFKGRFALLQDSLNVAVENLSNMMNQTRIAIHNVNTCANEISQSSLSLNERTQSQAASLQETAANMEQMTSAVQQNAVNAGKSSQVTQTTARQAAQSETVMNKAESSMKQIHESSQKINEIIGLIDNIAFQTNLLALNAAVEAARAGEHGKGFAVVAGEVRSLAGKSSDAARDIRQLIEDTVAKVAEGTDQVRASGEELHSIVASIENVNEMIDDIAASSQEQSEGVKQSNQAIAEIDSAVQENAALVEETTAMAEDLSGMADSMEENVAQFTLKPPTHEHNALKVGNFDFAAARRAHRQWRVKVRAYLNDFDIDFNRQSADDPTLCPLGTWLYKEGQTYQALTSFQVLEKSHANLHAFIGRIFDLKDVGDITVANDEMQKLEGLSLEVIEHIHALEDEISMGESQQQTAIKPQIQAPTPSQPQPNKITRIHQASAPIKQEHPDLDLAAATPQSPSESGDEWNDF
ncbi:hypothetical protein AVO42_09960 [Thiomicrospira sp. XS5]|uniref:methyl-accepting chemotaxis protein n=1 Tax=Thiomicrospira sp. XS5 TaxID=1775636 RepID=UPI000746B350|nr:methyl-accepting chemotaxis protein [Thiomicrospira sp. XS5]KUJ75616.1 hypothetical protein AVO42_09960 [Thiomicrospira sp. XS5]